MTSPNYLWDILGFVSETETERWAGERQASELSFSPYLTDNGYLLDYLPLYPWCLLLCCFRQNKPNNNEPSSNWQLLPAQLRNRKQMMISRMSALKDKTPEQKPSAEA